MTQTHNYKTEYSTPDLEQTLLDRGTTHGGFEDVASIALTLQRTARMAKENGIYEPSKTEEYALDMIFNKIARIIAGNSSFADHWTDIAGYAILGRDSVAADNNKKGE